MFSIEDIRIPVRTLMDPLLEPFEKKHGFSRVVYSGAYRKGIKYPTDIDINIHCTLDRLHGREFYVRQVQELFGRISAQPNIYMDTFESGVDTEFDFRQYINADGRITNYNSGLIRSKLRTLYRINRLSRDAYRKIHALVIDKPNIRQAVELCMALQPYTILTWTPTEVQDGIKMFSGNRLTLGASLMKTRATVKIILNLGQGILIDVDLNFLFYNEKSSLICVNGWRHCCVDNRTGYDMYTIVKFALKRKYYKVLKRFRTMYSTRQSNLHGIYPREKWREVRRSLKGTISRITDLADTRIGLLNHYIHQIGVIIDVIRLKHMRHSMFTETLRRLNGARLLATNPGQKALESLLGSINDRPKVSVILANLGILRTNLTDIMNSLVYPKLQPIYNELVEGGGAIFTPKLMRIIRNVRAAEVANESKIKV